MTDTATAAALLSSEPTASRDLDALWMPFSYNRHFKQAPRMFTRAKGMYLYDSAGRRILDGCSALWCVNAGHCRDEIVSAIQQTA